MTGPRVYLVGSLRNPIVVDVHKTLAAAGFDCFSEWFAAGPEADDYWQRHSKALGRPYREALASAAAQNVFAFDLRNILAADVVVLVAPAGKSGHLELGFAAGRGKPTFILMDEPKKADRWDVMALFAGEPIDDEELDFSDFYREPGVVYSIDELVERITAYMAALVLNSVPNNPERLT